MFLLKVSILVIFVSQLFLKVESVWYGTRLKFDDTEVPGCDPDDILVSNGFSFDGPGPKIPYPIKPYEYYKAEIKPFVRSISVELYRPVYSEVRIPIETEVQLYDCKYGDQAVVTADAERRFLNVSRDPRAVLQNTTAVVKIHQRYKSEHVGL